MGSEQPPELRDDGLSLVLLPETQVRALLRDRTLTLTLLLPPYPALGVGVLRVLRVAERDASTEIVAGYERYERLERPAAR